MIEQFLIGTYTHSTSEGVYQIELDTDKGQLQNLQLVAKAGNPTYLTESKAKKLYVVDKETENNETIGGILEFDLNNNDFPLETKQKVLDAPTSPAYVTVDEDRQLIYAANYHAGTVTTYKIQQDGTILLADRVFDEGIPGPRPEQQDGPHPHYSDLTPDKRLVVNDLGLDKVYLYDVSEDGKLNIISELQMESGFGPRHITFDESKGIAYLVGELSSKMAVLQYNESEGSFSVMQTIDTIPADYTEHNGVAAVRLSSDGKFVYVSNRGYNTIAVFAIDQNNEAKLIQQAQTKGDFPRDFNFSSDENFVVCVNQNTDNAILYKRDANTGMLTQVQQDFTVPEGVCVYPKK